MPQGPISVFSQYAGGSKSSINITAAAVVKAAPGCLYRIVIQAAGTSGTLTISDLATTSGAAAANQIISLTSAQLTTLIGNNGGVVTLEWPCQTGIAVTTCSGGIVANVAYS